jgi:hypothetical protein
MVEPIKKIPSVGDGAKKMTAAESAAKKIAQAPKQ